jgi:hypothetical protein
MCSRCTGSLADIGGAEGTAAKNGIAADGGAAADIIVGEAGSGMGAGSGADAGSGKGAGSGAGIGSGSKEGDGREEDGREDGGRDDGDGVGCGRRSGGESWISLRMDAFVQRSQLGGDSGGSMDGGGKDGGGDDVAYAGGVNRRLLSTSPSLSSSASHRRFLVRFAAGEMGGGDPAEARAPAVEAKTGNGHAVAVAEGHRWQQRRCLQTLAAVIRVGKRQNRVTSW